MSTGRGGLGSTGDLLVAVCRVVSSPSRRRTLWTLLLWAVKVPKGVVGSSMGSIAMVAGLWWWWWFRRIRSRKGNTSICRERWDRGLGMRDGMGCDEATASVVAMKLLQRKCACPWTCAFVS